MAGFSNGPREVLVSSMAPRDHAARVKSIASPRATDILQYLMTNGKAQQNLQACKGRVEICNCRLGAKLRGSVDKTYDLKVAGSNPAPVTSSECRFSLKSSWDDRPLTSRICRSSIRRESVSTCQVANTLIATSYPAPIGYDVSSARIRLRHDDNARLKLS